MINYVRRFLKGQKGISLASLLVALLVSGIIAGGATVASVQLLKAPAAVKGQAGDVITQTGQLSQGIYLQAPASRLQGYPKIEYAIIALNGNIALGGSALVKSDPASPAEGDIYANGNISVTMAPAEGKGVKGDATATGTISDPNSGISGTKTAGYSPAKTFTEITHSAYGARSVVLAMANLGGTQGTTSLTGGTTSLGPRHITGDLRLSGNAVLQLTGPIFVDGSITMGGNNRVQGQYTIAADGSITIGGNTKLSLDDLPFVVSYGTAGITVNGNPTSALLYAPNGPIDLGGSSTVYGSVIGQSVSDKGNNLVEYPVALRQ